ncbi:hypothetical protein BN2475_510024 [Paraburkholderia ribeironis]|uniref:Uncharacterized protein n=1 Tax=Paraburkholderia ribeironis TaxID=1247936 RepID=A0A1N7SC45_9BURK|nr:hypothetical protein BN2475_510024 [Paraburkholderia ribeironis]
MGHTTATEVLALLGNNPLWTLHEILKTGRWVDLTHCGRNVTAVVRLHQDEPRCALQSRPARVPGSCIHPRRTMGYAR